MGCVKHRPALFAASLLLSIGLVAAAVSLAPGPPAAIAGGQPTATPTATPCPTAKVPDTYHGAGCGTPTPTPTSQHPDPCSALRPGSLAMLIRTPCIVTMTPMPTATPCPTAKVPDTYHASGCGTPTPTPRPHALGDVNCDSRVNAIDAALILQYHARLIGSLRCADSADVNNDGAINSIDASLLLQYVAGHVPPFP